MEFTDGSWSYRCQSQSCLNVGVRGRRVLNTTDVVVTETNLTTFCLFSFLMSSFLDPTGLFEQSGGRTRSQSSPGGIRHHQVVVSKSLDLGGKQVFVRGGTILKTSLSGFNG